MSGALEQTPHGEGERKQLVARATVIGLGTLLSRLLGLLRDMTLARVFPKAATDAFFLAFTIPNALRQLLGEGAISAAVVPVLAERRSTSEDAGREFFQKARGASLLALAIVTLLGVAFARELTLLFASGYANNPPQLERTVRLTRILFPYIFFMGTAALGSAALHAKRQFAVAAFAPGLLNVAFLITSFGLPTVLASRGIDPALSMGVGAILGGILQMVVQWPALKKIGYFARPQIDFSDPYVRRMLARMPPIMAGIGVYYIDLVLSRRFLSELGEGAQSYFSWASRVCDFPQGIFVMAIGAASLPSLMDLAAKRDLPELRKTFAYGLRLSLFVAIPASIALVALAEPVTALLFQGGKFGSLETAQTARALAVQGSAIFTVAAVRQTIPVFHALGDTRTPVVISALDLAVFVLLAVSLRGPLGHVGISVAIAGSSCFQMLLLLVALRRRLGSIAGHELLGSACRTLAASLLAGTAGWGASMLPSIVLGGPAALWLPGLSGLATFTVTFFAAAWGLRCAEFEAIAEGLARRIRRSVV
jgi:putative peptidoglycan lipid II flippase